MTGEGMRWSIASEMDVTRAVLEVGSASAQAGFDETGSRMVATAVSELARNILKYAGAGEVRFRIVEGRIQRGIEIEARDEGPGIEDPAQAMQDHFSSGGTLGLGLPGVKRLMDDFRLESEPGKGTRITARKWLAG